MSRGPGRWQRLLLDALEERPWVRPAVEAAVVLGRQLTPAEYAAVNRAAGRLVEANRARHARAWGWDVTGRRHTTVTVLVRPGAELPHSTSRKPLPPRADVSVEGGEYSPPSTHTALADAV